uniref:Uncharacterized protein n=1 Tax=Octopus bimaculoides TaxID=37653 RepID=A0A0L8GIC7_OCTBM
MFILCIRIETSVLSRGLYKDHCLILCYKDKRPILWYSVPSHGREDTYGV